QARGEELDTRTVMFSFGAVLYEMTTGYRAFSGTSSAIIFDAILHQAPTSPMRLNPQCPPELERILTKTLEKDRELRYQSAADLHSKLKRLKLDTESGPTVHREARHLHWPLALAAAVLVLAIGGVIGYRYFRPSSKVAGPPMRIIPFTSFPGQ